MKSHCTIYYMKINVMSVFGTRPEAIKMAPLINELKKHKEINSVVCVSAQHREMLDQVLTLFNIIPDYDLDIMTPKQTLTDITTRLMENIEPVLRKERPDIVLVHGDTTTTLSVALACFYQQIAVGHVEAGLRTNNKYSPFPEEMNRVLTSKISDLHFAPTKVAYNNLVNEGIQRDRIIITGNTVIDALNTTIDKYFSHPLLSWANNSKIILLTMHRRENSGEPMINVFKAIRNIAENFSDVTIIFPVHLNPNIRKVANEFLADLHNVKLIEPLNAIEFHNFMSKSYLIITDSGGVQEEASSLGIPVLVLRETTERPEGVLAGTLRLVGTDTNVLYREIRMLLEDKKLYEEMAHSKNPYGDGFASRKIVESIIEYFNNK